MSYFLVVYDRRAGHLLRDEEFVDRRDALSARFAAESQLEHGSDVEVVVLGAKSHDALARTHARYFKSTAELAEEALASA